MRFEKHPVDFGAIDALNRAAFPVPFEATLIRTLRASGAMVAEHALYDGDRLIAHVAYSPVRVEGMETERRLLGLGPMAVAPDAQGKGHGLALLRASVAAAPADAILLLGHTGFYAKAGFGPASRFGLYFAGVPEVDDHFMAFECEPGALAGLKGRIAYDPAFYDESA